MGGRNYFCDYCQVRIQNNPHIIRKHNEGLLHQKSKNSYYEKYKSLKEILSIEKTKLPCKRAATNSCAFGALCRFSHYSPSELALMEEQCQEIDRIETSKEASIDEFLQNIQRQKLSFGFKIYSEMPESLLLPPSTQIWNMDKVDLKDLDTNWG